GALRGRAGDAALLRPAALDIGPPADVRRTRNCADVATAPRAHARTAGGAAAPRRGAPDVAPGRADGEGRGAAPPRPRRRRAHLRVQARSDRPDAGRGVRLRVPRREDARREPPDDGAA